MVATNEGRGLCYSFFFIGAIQGRWPTFSHDSKRQPPTSCRCRSIGRPESFSWSEIFDSLALVSTYSVTIKMEKRVPQLSFFSRRLSHCLFFSFSLFSDGHLEFELDSTKPRLVATGFSSQTLSLERIQSFSIFLFSRLCTLINIFYFYFRIVSISIRAIAWKEIESVVMSRLRHWL